MNIKVRTFMVNTIMVITKNMKKKQTNTTNLIMLIKVVKMFMENIIKVITKNMHKEKKLMLSMIMIMKWMMKMTIVGYGYFL